MYFEYDNTGRILVCAETPVKPNMVEITVPENFDQAEMHNWRVENEVLVYCPLPVEETPSDSERIAALEEEFVTKVTALQKQVDEQAAMIVAYESAYMEGVQQA